MDSSHDDQDFSGRSVFVTGGAQGIGRAIALAFLTRGASVTILDADPEAVAEAEDALAVDAPDDAAPSILAIAGDVSVEDHVAQAVQAAVDAHGSLDILVNNAGFMIRKPIEELELDEWNRVLGVNLTGAFLCAKHAAPHLRDAPGGGCIINIASTRALMSEPDTESYSASKGGITALTHALAVSLGPEVRVNAIAPGWIDVSAWKKSSQAHQQRLSTADHAQHPAGRVGTPQDIAELACFLASPAAGFITGQTIVADGGMTRKMIYVE